MELGGTPARNERLSFNVVFLMCANDEVDNLLFEILVESFD